MCAGEPRWCSLSTWAESEAWEIRVLSVNSQSCHNVNRLIVDELAACLEKECIHTIMIRQYASMTSFHSGDATAGR